MYRVRPIGIVEGKYSGKKTVIVDVTSPRESEEHSSINNLIDKEQCTLSYVWIDDAIRAIQDFGRFSILNKVDISDAFKQLGISTICTVSNGESYITIMYVFVLVHAHHLKFLTICQ